MKLHMGKKCLFALNGRSVAYVIYNVWLTSLQLSSAWTFVITVSFNEFVWFAQTSGGSVSLKQVVTFCYTVQMLFLWFSFFFLFLSKFTLWKWQFCFHFMNALYGMSARETENVLSQQNTKGLLCFAVWQRSMFRTQRFVEISHEH